MLTFAPKVRRFIGYDAGESFIDRFEVNGDDGKVFTSWTRQKDPNQLAKRIVDIAPDDNG
jgi:hypothetical protein